MRHLLLMICAVLALLGITLGCTGESTVSPASKEEEPIADAVIADITNAQALAMIGERSEDADFHIIDVRTPSEYASGHVAGAVNLDYNGGVFAASLDSLVADDTYLLICRSGGRSAGARDLMKNAGFTSVYNMIGGMNQWNADDYPVTTQ